MVATISISLSPMPGLATMVVVPVNLECDGQSVSLLPAGRVLEHRVGGARHDVLCSTQAG